VAAVTVRVTVADCCKLPDVPVIVTVYVPAAVAEVVDTVTVELPEVLIDAELKPAVAPVGSPLALSVTVPVIVTVYVPAGVAEVVAIVTVELPEVLMEVGLKLAVAPAGRPLSANHTGPLSAAPTVAV